eukprot:jgi/Botrbrau1/7159/Bobra.0143s0031.1
MEPNVPPAEPTPKEEPSTGSGKSDTKMVDADVDVLADAKAAHKAAHAVTGKLDGAALPVRAYLEQAIVPVLMAGMQQVVRERPDDPIEFLGQYLLKNNPKKLPQQNGSPHD